MNGRLPEAIKGMENQEKGLINVLVWLAKISGAISG